MSPPKPGRSARGSTTGRPIMVLLDLLGRRWVLRILWELRDAPLGFRALQSRCDGMSPSVLSQRLTELREADVVTPSDAGEYRLTIEGHALLGVLQPLNEWAARWDARSASKSTAGEGNHQRSAE